jgi:hypothetical protein
VDDTTELELEIGEDETSRLDDDTGCNSRVIAQGVQGIPSPEFPGLMYVELMVMVGGAE